MPINITNRPVNIAEGEQLPAMGDVTALTPAELSGEYMGLIIQDEETGGLINLTNSPIEIRPGVVIPAMSSITDLAPGQFNNAYAGVLVSGGITVTGNPPALTVGEAYTFTYGIAGGAEPYDVIGSGDLPDGVAHNATTRTFSGTPTEAGDFDYLVEVEDADGQTASRTFHFSVADVGPGPGPEPGDLTVSVEEDGWVLAVRSEWDEPVVYSAFALDPDGTPKVTLTVHSAGFDRIGGQAVPNPARVRQIVATKPIRKPYPDQADVFEIDHGDGTRTVRLALSERVYAGDVVAACSFAAGWHAGEGADTPAVTNNSTRDVPLPIVRVASPSWSMIEGPGSRFDLLVASHHPEHHGVELHQAVAAVKFTATDQTNTNEVWITGLSTSTVYGDNLRCFGLDPVTSGLFDGLTPGTIVTQWTVYPWIGAPRTCGPMTYQQAVTAARGIGPEQPFTCTYDPGRTLYARRYVFVDAATGSETAGDVTIAATVADAKAGTAAATISVAAQALALQNVTIPAANGIGQFSRNVGWCNIVLAAGVQTWGSQSLNSTSIIAGSARLVIQGDPDDPGPRANCIWRSGSSSFSTPDGAGRFWLDSLELQLGEASLISSAQRFFHLNNVTMRGKPGFEAGTHLLHVTDAPAGEYQLSATNSSLSHYGVGLTGNKSRAGLLRNFRSGTQTAAVTHVTSSKVKNTEASANTRDRSLDFVNGTTDYMLWQCDAYANDGSFIRAESDSVGGITRAVRVAIVASIVERSGSATGRFFSYGTSNDSLVDCIFDGFTAVGNAINMHNDSPGRNINHPNTIYINSWIDRNATKHDVFGMDGTKTAGWEILYGVGYRGNVNNNRIPSDPSNFQYEYYGRGSTMRTNFSPPIGSNDYPKYADDLSSYGPESGGQEGAATSGWGNYRPAAGSPAAGRAGVSNLDVYLDGVTPRPAVGAAGALAEA